jgi:hypothetical protein
VFQVIAIPTRLSGLHNHVVTKRDFPLGAVFHHNLQRLSETELTGRGASPRQSSGVLLFLNPLVEEPHHLVFIQAAMLATVPNFVSTQS